MAKFQQYAGWAVAGIVLVAAIGVFAGMALPLFADISSESTEIMNAATELQNAIATDPKPVEADIQGYVAARQHLVDQYNRVVNYYDAHDKKLEEWFPGVNINPPVTGYPVTAGDWRNAYLDHMNALDKKVLDKLPNALGYTVLDQKEDEFKIVRGFNWERMAEQTLFDKLTNERMRLFQKRYWIREWIAGIVVDPGVEVSRLLEVHFMMEDTDFDAQVQIMPSSFGESIQGIEFDPGFFPVKSSGGGRQTTIENEFALPKNLGRTLTFGVAVMLPYAKVPEFLDRLQRVTENGPLVHVVACKISVQNQNPFTFKKEVEPGTKADEENRLRQLFGSRHPVVAITAYVIDVDATKRENF